MRKLREALCGRGGLIGQGWVGVRKERGSGMGSRVVTRRKGGYKILSGIHEKAPIQQKKEPELKTECIIKN